MTFEDEIEGCLQIDDRTKQFIIRTKDKYCYEKQKVKDFINFLERNCCILDEDIGLFHSEGEREDYVKKKKKLFADEK